MAKVTAPLLSFNAGGAIAKTQVYASWKGIPYVRRYVVPSNPQSGAQTETRSVFKTLSQLFKSYTTDSVAPWIAFAAGKPMTDRNALMKFDVAALRPGSDWSAYIGSPGALGGVPLASFAATGAAGAITTSVTLPTPPTGWTIAKVVATARINDDPHTTTDYSIETESATATPWQPGFTGLAAGSYIVTAWPVWDTGSGVLAYGLSTTVTATVT
jgi:hypothetical protein